MDLPRVTIRLAESRDAARCAAIYRPAVEDAAISFETVAPDEDEMRQRLEETLRVHPWLVCERHNEVIGYAYASRHRVRAAYRWAVDVSAYVDPSARRCGVGRGLYTSLIRLLVAQGFVTAYAGITLPNVASVALHESVGFRPFAVYRNVGYKLGAWHDVGWWVLTLQPPPAEPAEPVGIEVLRREPEWSMWLAAGVASIDLDAST